jgi:hypothetical protein
MHILTHTFALAILLITVWPSILHAQRLEVSVGRNVQVSAPKASLGHAELHAGADPGNAKRLIVCTMVDRLEGKYPMTSVVYMSSDGGATWRAALDAEKLGYPYMSDPKCGFGPNGIAYYSGYGTNPHIPYGGKDKPEEPGLSEYFFSSRDGGTTWSKPTPLIGNRLGRASLTIDNTTGPRRGTIYWNGIVVVPDLIERTWRIGYVLYRSTDRGYSFQSSVLHAPNAAVNIGRIGGNSVVLSEGTFVSVFTSEPMGMGGSAPLDSLNFIGDTTNKALVDSCLMFAVISNDGAISVEKPVRVSNCFRADGLKKGKGPGTIGFPTLATDRSKGQYRDRMYLVWPDNRSGRHEVLLVTSSDRGKTWSAPQVINDDPPPATVADGKDMMHPTVAVNPDGIVGVVWAERQSADDSGSWKVRFRASSDGGATWTASVHVNGQKAGDKVIMPTPRRAAADSSRDGGALSEASAANAFFKLDGGDTWSMVADAAGVFHPFWTDRRTGILQLWTAPIRVKVAQPTR